MLLPGKKLVIYELNEVPRRVLDLHVRHHPDGALAQVLRRGTYADTHAADGGILSPWITWPTVHRGVNNERHCISDFGQDLTEVDREYPPIWQLLASQNVRVGLFGSLHSYPLPREKAGYDFYVPDTFAAGPETMPERLNPFQEFNLAMVDSSARNVGSRVALKPAYRLLRNAAALGLRPTTLLRVAKQIAHERVKPIRKVRRRTSQVQLAFDLFMKQLRDNRPDYATFFTNHVASSMHRYWPATFPEDYQQKQLPDQWAHSYGDEIGFAMREADRQLSQIMSFIKQDTSYALMILTSMGQAAVDDCEMVRTQLYVNDRDQFMRRLGVEPDQWSSRRAMLPRYVFQVDASVSEKFRHQLGTLKVNGQLVETAEHAANVFMVKMGHINLDDTKLEVSLGGQIVDWHGLGLQNEVIEDATGSYAYHIPHGVLLVYDPSNEQGQRIEAAVPTTEIAPMTLRNFNLAVPSYMS